MSDTPKTGFPAQLLKTTGAPPARRRRLGAAPRARTLLDIFDATAIRCGDAVAIDAPDRSCTYRELSAAASALGRRLAAQGVGPGDRVGVRVRSGTAELYVAILGVLWSGAAYVPIDAEDPPARARELLRSAGACALVRDGLAIDRLSEASGQEREPTVDDDAWVIFTSGSTGQPKAVAVTHRAAAAFVDAEARLWSVGREDRVMAGLSVSFDASCEEIWLAWRNGAALVPAPRTLVRSGVELGRWIAANGVSVISTVPTLAAMWELGDLAGVRLLVLGGEACPEELGWRLAEGREVWNTYGPTEATVVSTAARIRPGEPLTIGWPLEGWQTAIVDEDGQPVAIGESGELVIAGRGLARYLDRELDAERFAALPSLGWDRAYRSGDIVRESIHGFQFIGRRDDQVKIDGRRVELGELDAVFAQAPGVRAAMCAVRQSAAGNRLLVAYLVGDLDIDAVRAWAGERLPEGLIPQIVSLEALPLSRAGKADRNALPWPPPAVKQQADENLDAGERWLAERWQEQLGPQTLNAGSDFFKLGGGSLAAAKMVSVLRERYPGVAIADVYNNRTLGALSERLRQLGAIKPAAAHERAERGRAWRAAHLALSLVTVAMGAPAWLIGALAIDRLYPGAIGPQVSWGYLIAGWLLFASVPGRALLVLLARRLLLSGMSAGRYSRHSSLMLRIWLVERVAETFHLDRIAGTPWAARYARLIGHDVAPDAYLGTLPPPTGIVHIGSGATLEGDVDMRGWWIEGQQLVIGEVTVGVDARVGARTALLPGAVVGAGAEVEPGSVVSGMVPAGQRWSGSPARQQGAAGGWPARAPEAAAHRRFWRALFAAGLFFESLLSLLAAAPGIGLLLAVAPTSSDPAVIVGSALLLAPAMSLLFIVAYALIVAVVFRAVNRLIVPGLHAADGATGWAGWFAESLMGEARGMLFPLFSSIFVAPWLRLAGISVGDRAEVSTVVGLTRLVSFARKSFVADDVLLAGARANRGWIEITPITVGEESFLGNGAVLQSGTEIGERSLVGVLSVPPRDPAPRTSWFGAPALEIPRVAESADPRRTVEPPRRLVLARGCIEFIRIMLPATISALLGALAFWGLDAAGEHGGAVLMLLAAPALLLAAGIVATLATIAIKWTLIGRYRAGLHPLWSLFVWRDEIVNTCQEQLAGAWLLNSVLGSPLMPLYLRLMGAKVGRDVWCETLTITEFELADIGDGCVINRHAVVETHLFHDRLMRIGAARMGAGSTLGPYSAMLPEAALGDECIVGSRSVVMSGEELPARSSWHGAPVVATRH